MHQVRLSLALWIALLAGCTGDTRTESPVDVSAAPGDGESTDSPSPDRSATQPATPQPAEELQPIEIAEAYFGLLREGRGPEAVRRHWDTQLFARRLYGADLDALSPEDQAEVAREHERFLMAIYANPATAAVMKRVEITNVNEARDGDSCIVTFDAALGAEQPPKPQRLLFLKRDGQWRIVDVATADGAEFMTRIVHRIYKSTGTTPLQYAQSMTKELPALNSMIDQSDQARQRGPSR